MYDPFSPSPSQPLPKIPSQLLRFILIFFIIIGVIVRFVALDQKVYWFDEVYTNLRAGGWQTETIQQDIFQNQIIPATQLQKYQSIKPNSTTADTLNSLALEDPQHPPLYFFMARQWMRSFGSSITASRCLPALLSLFSLPLMYGLARELFHSPAAGLMATALIAISPVEILWAQTARQYSLLTVFIIASSYALLKATRSKQSLFWAIYTVTCTLGFYTHPFFGLTVLAHAAYILLLQFNPPQSSQRSVFSPILPFFLSSIATLAMYSPWMRILWINLDRMMATTGWTKASVSLLDWLKFGVLNITVPFVDTDLGLNDFHNYLVRFPILVILSLAFIQICTKTPLSIRLFVLTLTIIPFFTLLLPDVLIGGRRSTVTRYLISCFPGLHLAVSYWFSTYIQPQKIAVLNGAKTWRVILIAVLVMSLISCTMSAFASTWWSKGVSYLNGEIAAQINRIDSPLVVTDKGNSGLNTGNLMSLSYLLDQDVELLPMSSNPNFYLLPINSTVFVYAPSQQLKQALSPQYGQLEEVIPGYNLLFYLRN